MINVDGVDIPVELEHKARRAEAEKAGAGTALVEQYIQSDPERAAVANGFRKRRAEEVAKERERLASASEPAKDELPSPSEFLATKDTAIVRPASRRKAPNSGEE